MCVHLVKKNGLEATVLAYEESIPKSPQAYFSKKPSAHKAGRVPFTEVLRSKENDNLTGKAFNVSYVEEHRLSPQHSLTVLKRASTDWYEDPSKRKCGPRGLNDRYKNRPLSGSGKTPAVATFW